jgi:transposase
MRYYCGIDLHSNNCVLVVIDAEGVVIFKRRVRNELGLIVAALAAYGPALSGVVVESTYNWYWLVDGLQDAGFRLHLANPAAIKQYSGLKHTDDSDDAAWLAQLLRLDILAEGYIYPRESRGTRDLLRRRGQLVRQRTANLLSVQNQVTRSSGKQISGNRVKTLLPSELDELPVDRDASLGIAANLTVMACLKQQILALEKEILPRLVADDVYQALLTTPGIGKILGMTIRLESGAIERFAGPGNYASYCRCVSSKRLSNNKVKGQGNIKNGNKYLSWAFVEAAHMAIRYDERARRYYQRKKARTMTVVATKAVAHKLARASYHVMRHKIPFEPARCFG